MDEHQQRTLIGPFLVGYKAYHDLVLGCFSFLSPFFHFPFPFRHCLVCFLLFRGQVRLEWYTCTEVIDPVTELMQELGEVGRPMKLIFPANETGSRRHLSLRACGHAALVLH